MTPIKPTPDVLKKIRALNKVKAAAEQKARMVGSHFQIYVKAIQDALEIPPDWELDMRYGEFRPPSEPEENKSAEVPHPPAVRIEPKSARDQAG